MSLAVISLAVLPVLAACATASPNDFTADAYPAQTIGDAFKSSLEPSPPPPAGPAASPNCPAAPAGQRGPAGPVGACSAAAAARAPSAPPTDEERAASAYPSVALSDLIFGSPKPAPR